METTPAPPDNPTRVRRIRWAWLATALVVGALLSGYLIVAHTYSLEPGSMAGSPVDGMTCHAGDATEYNYPYQGGQNLPVTVSFRNAGRFPVTVLGITRHEYVPLGYWLGLHGPNATECS